MPSIGKHPGNDLHLTTCGKRQLNSSAISILKPLAGMPYPSLYSFCNNRREPDSDIHCIFGNYAKGIAQPEFRPVIIRQFKALLFD